MRMRRAMTRMLRLPGTVKKPVGAPITETVEDSATRHKRPPLRTREAMVWLYVAALAVVAGGAWLLLTHADPAHARPQLPWWAVALGFAFAEICVVHVRFRRSAHSFSLADVPFVFGLVFASGDALVIGALVGTGIVWGLIRRLPPIKLAFNLAQLALAASLAAGVLSLVSDNAATPEISTCSGLDAAPITRRAVTIL